MLSSLPIKAANVFNVAYAWLGFTREVISRGPATLYAP
jgi:hypothetical protein